RPILDPFRVARVIARPFVGDARRGFTRTYNRHDFSIEPPSPTLLDRLKQAGREVIGVGKIEDIFAGCGLTRSERTHGNVEGMARLLELVHEVEGPALVFVNLIDFDMLYGHRRDPSGYARALQEADRAFVPVLAALRPDDLLVITADHGCDPTFAASTDHTREQVPLLAYRPGRAGQPLGRRSTFADVGQTIAEGLGLPSLDAGTSFLSSTQGVAR
ncbi:MAG: phosphopentomutase, partial [Deltaproteobacteria bacterium]|nr:phosphopentomutase [Deltaproteobacteria bacterium]